MRIPDLVLEHRTARLVRVVKAFTLAEDMEAKAARDWNNAAQAIRMLAEADEFTACGELAGKFSSMVETLDLDKPMLDWPALITKAAAAVVNATGPKRDVR